MSSSKLFQPITVGDIILQHRVALAPLTRRRASTQHVNGDIAVEYYRQRASEPGTLLISEGIFFSGKVRGLSNVPVFGTRNRLPPGRRLVLITKCPILHGAELRPIGDRCRP